MRLIFCASRKPVSGIIRALTWSSWSHVAIIDGDEVVEAVFPRVRRVPLNAIRAKYDRFLIVNVDFGIDDNMAISAICSEIGKRYDFAALFGLPLKRDWQDSSRWFCSELVAFGLLTAGLAFEKSIHRITPNDIWFMSLSKLVKFEGKGIYA